MLGLGCKDVSNECLCVFGADFEQICIVQIEILCVKSLVIRATTDVQFL